MGEGGGEEKSGKKNEKVFPGGGKNIFFMRLGKALIVFKFIIGIVVTTFKSAPRNRGVTNENRRNCLQ